MDVSLVIPGRNAEATLPACLASVVPMLASGELREILFVDDGSTDRTAEIAGRSSARLIRGRGAGPGAARNLGWRAAAAPLVWFIDSDCVARPDALARLVEHFSSPEVAGCGGSYDNLHPESLTATLIHEEIVERHRRMPVTVDFLATFNVVYRRRDLERVGGFDERLRMAQDAELAYRIRAAGGRLEFDARSRVGHHHERRLGPYLAKQRRQGYWRMWLYGRHPAATAGDSYSGLSDHLQPPAAVLVIAGLPLVAIGGWWISAGALAALALTQVPMTHRLLARHRRAWCLLFPLFSMLRAFWRGAGMLQGAAAALLHGARRRCSLPQPRT